MDRTHRTPDSISATDAAARFLGVLLLVVVGYAHLLDLSHKVDEGIWYMVVAFVALIVAAVCLAVALVRCRAPAVRSVWLAAATISLAALAGYAISRLIALPGMADHQGDWVSTYGLLALFGETALIALAGYAMRSLTVSGVPHRPPSWLRIPAGGLVLPMTIMLMTLVALPSRAIAHGGEEDEEAPAAAAAGSGNPGSGRSADTSPAAVESSGGGGHGDPFLGTSELGIALLLAAGFTFWAARSLRERVRLEPLGG